MSNYTIHEGDALASLQKMPAQSVQTCVTSPPYYGLRNYNVDGQIGLESTPEAFIARLVEVFRDVRRVLRDDGTLWANIGDSYAGGGFGGHPDNKAAIGVNGRAVNIAPGIKPKDLIGIPWMLAFALRADGWYLRSQIIWHKPNPMPESVTDRPTKAHEEIFLLSKSARYYYDNEAVKETSSSYNAQWATRKPTRANIAGNMSERGVTRTTEGLNVKPSWEKASETRNRRSVWTVSTKPYKGAHFATFPPDLIEPCILAGSPEGGTVLDPFGGSGTTAMVALKHNRNAVLCELNPEYVSLIHQRCAPYVSQPSLPVRSASSQSAFASI